jgi:Ydr279p protein triple barrel domain
MKDDSNMLVALQAPGLASEFEIHNLADPATGEVRPYLVCGKQLCEMTAVNSSCALDDNYRSFAVAGTGVAVQYIVQNGTLHVISPVDALFWLLRDEQLSCDVTSKAQWQPVNQILNQYDPVIANSIKQQPKQLKHVMVEMALSEDETYAKFSVDNAVRWLQSKQQAVEAVLYRQIVQHTAKKQTSPTGGGAFLSGFTIAEDESENARLNRNVTTTTQTKTDNSVQLKQRAKEESIQVVCNYLSPLWRERFLQHLQVSANILESGEQQAKRPKVAESSLSHVLPPVRTDWNAAVSGVDDAASKQKTKAAAAIANPITAGSKRLLKANKKGLQKMSSFFGIKKK